MQHSHYSFFDKLRDNIVISDIIKQKVTLTKRGQEYTGLCPFHSEKSPSFTVNDIKKFYHCFGCGAHGDVIKFIVETKGFSYIEAAKKLAEDHGIEIPKQNAEEKRIYEEGENILHVLNLANQFFTSHMNKPAADYLTNRKISQNIIEKYSIGFTGTGKNLQKYLEEKNIALPMMYSAGLIGKNEGGDTYPIFRNRITFPIKNIYGKIIAFGGRILGEGMPKYLNSPESLVFKKSETLYGEDIATGAAYQKKHIIIVEGYLDVIAMHNAGFLQTVATLGTAVTKEHLNKLWRISDELIFCLDGDSAGQRAMKKAIILLLPLVTNARKASFLILPNGMDPDELLDRMGKNYLEQMMEQRLPTSEMIWHLETSGKKLTTPESKAELEVKLEEYVGLLNNTPLAYHIRREFKNKMWNLGRTKKANKPQNQDNVLIDTKTPIEIIEYTICSIILKQPQLISNEKIYHEFIHLEFRNLLLGEIREFIIELYSEKHELTQDIIKENLQKSRFSDLFILLSSDKTIFLDILSLNNTKGNHDALWHWLVKKHELELLKEEYERIIKSAQSDRFEKANAYLKEINNAETIIKELNEILAS
jgi:DNA primase